MNPIELSERGLVPDFVLRAGIRRLIAKRLERESRDGPDAIGERKRELIASLAEGPIAEDADKANEQHYELPAIFFDKVLGKHRKYSCGLWRDKGVNIDDSEADMLRLTCERADLRDGQRILELGCGWGSLTLWMASHYPSSRVAAVSNSASQRQYIMERARDLGLPNVEVVTADINDFHTDMRFDRIVSVEMFEHMRNYGELMSRIAGWLDSDGKLFVHVFCHRQLAYPFQVEGEYDWMARHFFTGGIMPSADTLLHFQQNLVLEDTWLVSGEHYRDTSNAWLSRMDSNKRDIMPIFERVYGKKQAARWFQRWRMFFMACAELFGFRKGTEWMVAHYRFSHRSGS